MNILWLTLYIDKFKWLFQIDLSLVGDDEGFFSLESSGHDEDGVLTAMLKTAADVVIDRETEVGGSAKRVSQKR